MEDENKEFEVGEIVQCLFSPHNEHALEILDVVYLLDKEEFLITAVSHCTGRKFVAEAFNFLRLDSSLLKSFNCEKCQLEAMEHMIAQQYPEHLDVSESG